MAGRVRAGSENGLSDIGFTVAVSATGFPGPASGIGLLGSGSSLVSALSCPNGIGDGAAESRLLGSGYGWRCGSYLWRPRLRPSPVDLASWERRSE